MQQKFKLNHFKHYQLDAIESTVKLFEGSRKLDKSYVDFVDGITPNKLTISENEIFENLKEIQTINEIPKSEKLDGMDFSIEMETGTGKTYVYLRTIYELNKMYGFTKFMIVVPTVAIREGIIQEYSNTKDDFSILYDRIPIQCTKYESKNLTKVKDFCRSNKMEIMIITLDAFNKDNNILNRPQPERGFYGKKPIELIQKTNPILILDEPQNMDSSNSISSLQNLNPLFTLRYSATHKNFYNLLYSLSPVDAYEQKLVKRIEVLSIVEDNNVNAATIECVSIPDVKNNKIKAKLKINKKIAGKIKTKSIIVYQDDDLKDITNIEQYRGYVVDDIFIGKHVKFRNGVIIKLGEHSGSTTQEIQKIQIREAIIAHFDKQVELKDKGIKVLSLFFIDKVANYQNNGILQKFFDEEFNKEKMKYPDFKHLEPKTVRDGYFSNMRSTESMKNDSSAFEKIMKAKDRLVSFSEPTSFIFSHTALREGWDNPNVFVICTLNQSISDMRKRQEVGRGLRLPVNQRLEQQTDQQYDLRVISNQSYDDYVQSLQEHYDLDYGSGSSPPIENVRDIDYVHLDTKKIESDEFNNLWNKISQYTTYSTRIDSDELIKYCIENINEKLKMNDIRIRKTLASISIKKQGDNAVLIEPKILGVGANEIQHDFKIGNIVDELSQKVNITRKTIVKILTGINNLNLIFKNPQEFIMTVSLIIKNTLNSQIIKNIQYEPVLGKYGWTLFKDSIKSYKYKTVDTSNSIYDKIIFDYNFEKEFAQKLSRESERVKLYLKMPNWFTIDTPVGKYNPDWAIVSEMKDTRGQSQGRSYFIIETKAKKESDRGDNEKYKIKCGRKHFKSLGIQYEVIEELSQLDDLLSNKTITDSLQ